MRIYNRREFMALPAGTVFCKGRPAVFEGLRVKGETDGNDFEVRDLKWIDANDSGQAFDRLDEMEKNGASYPMETAYGRDGFFDEQDVFLVYEPADLEELSRVMAEAIRVAGVTV